MSLRFFLLVLAIILPQVLAHSFEVKNAPVRITSETMQLNYGQNIVKYFEKVEVHQNDFTVKCDVMTVYYNNNGGDAMQAGSIDKIEFDRNVVVIKAEKTAEGESGLFDPKVEKITLRGNVVLKDKKSSLKGETVVYDMVSKVFNVTNNTKSESRRVKVVVSDEQVNAKK